MEENSQNNGEIFNQGWENDSFSEENSVENGESVNLLVDETVENEEISSFEGKETNTGNDNLIREISIPVRNGNSEGGDEALHRDFINFALEHPEIKNGDIPNEVWKKVISGESLSSAWAKHENEGLKQRIYELEQAELNRQRSAGSRASQGKGERVDPFDEGWQTI
jgi:hypothetical protein